VALAWALANTDLATVVIGVSKEAHLDDNLKALECYHKWSRVREERIEAIL